MISNEKLKITKELDGDKTVVRLAGHIDEDAEFDELDSMTGVVVFNFGDVESINSCGVRNWVNFIKNLNIPFSYADCPPPIVRQLNMVPSFMGQADILSVYVPYVCDDCDHEKLELVDKTTLEKGIDKIPEFIQCDSCGSEEMGLDGQPEQYFAFAKGLRKAG